jgi:hypothetical protein
LTTNDFYNAYLGKMPPTTNAKTPAINPRKKLDSDGKYVKAKGIRVGRLSRLEKITSVTPDLDLTVAFQNHLCQPVFGLTTDDFYNAYLGKMPPTTNAKTPVIDPRKKIDSNGKYVKAKGIKVGQLSRLEKITSVAPGLDLAVAF